MSTHNQQHKRHAKRLVLIAVSVFCSAGVIGGTVAAVAAANPQHSGILPLNSRDLPAAKAAAIRSMEAAQRKAALHPMPKNPRYAPPADPQPARKSAVFPSHQSPLPPSQFLVSNGWQGPGTVGGQWLVVYAGESVKGGHSVPALLIYVEPTNPNAANLYFRQVGLYSDSAAAGQLSVKAVRNGVLTLAIAAPPTTSSRSKTSPAVKEITFILSTHTFK